MGAYRYVITTQVVEIDWLDNAGKEHRDRAAVAIYAFKPSWSRDEMNRRWHFATCQPWINAWKRSGAEKPSLVVIGERDERTKAVYFHGESAVWRVTAYTFMDDYTPTVGRVIISHRAESVG